MNPTEESKVLYFGEVILWVLVVWAHWHSEEEGGVSMHPMQSWVDSFARDIGYDLAVEPLVRV